MKKSTNDFDFVAPFYDLLARIIFGKNIKIAQTHFLNHIPDNASILVLGGGSGWILKEIFARNTNCQIHYVEKSKKMLTLSKKQLTATELEKIMFSHEINSSTNQVFDVIITNFFLDVFEKKRLENMMKVLQGLLHKKSIWLYTDFQYRNIWWQKVLLKLMFTFFRLFANLESKQLYDYEKVFNSVKMKSYESKSFFQEMIVSHVYRKR